MTITTPRKPSQVAAVLRSLKANAKEAGLPIKYAVHCAYYDYSQDGKPSEWIVGSNTEDGSSSLVYREGNWYYRDPHTGEDRPVKGGYHEALGNTRCWFTG